ncbi:MAG: pyruvate ferredoxin oxidoreductase, partial [Candidatus Omnitrophota bacterium]
HQDAIGIRDTGWVQFFAENNQEVYDMVLQAYKLAENPKTMLPVMINMDGYILTHGMESVEVSSQELVDKFLPSYNPPYKLDVDNPVSMGLLGDPTVYLETRYAIQKTLEDVVGIVPKIGKEFESHFGRSGLDLVEAYQLDDAKIVIVAMGSVCGTIKDFIDQARSQGEKIGLLRIITYRPFPQATVSELLKGKKTVAVLDKAISLGCEGPLYTEIRSLISGEKLRACGFIAGLGGRDITMGTIKKMVDLSKRKESRCQFLDVNESLLQEEFSL